MLHIIQQWNLRGCRMCLGMLCVYTIVCGTAYAQVEDISLVDDIKSVSVSDQSDLEIGGTGTQRVSSLVKFILIRIVYPLVLLVGLISAVLGVWNMMFSQEEGAYEQGRNYLIYGTAGIVLITLAGFLTSQLVGDTGSGGILGGGEKLAGASLWDVAQNLNNIMVPFVRIGSYLASGVLFIILLWNAIKIVTSGADDAPQQAIRIVTWNTIGILVILGAQYLVNLVFNISDGSGSIEGISIAAATSPIYQLINIALGMVVVVMVVIIIFMAFQLLVKPTDEGVAQQLRRSILYMFIGVLIIVFAYVMVNFLVVGNVRS